MQSCGTGHVATPVMQYNEKCDFYFETGNNPALVIVGVFYECLRVR